MPKKRKTVSIKNPSNVARHKAAYLGRLVTAENCRKASVVAKDLDRRSMSPAARKVVDRALVRFANVCHGPAWRAAQDFR